MYDQLRPQSNFGTRNFGCRVRAIMSFAWRTCDNILRTCLSATQAVRVSFLSTLSALIIESTDIFTWKMKWNEMQDHHYDARIFSQWQSKQPFLLVSGFRALSISVCQHGTEPAPYQLRQIDMRERKLSSIRQEHDAQHILVLGLAICTEASLHT